MKKSDLVSMICEIRDVIGNKLTDAQVEEFVLDYLDSGFLRLGFPDLQEHQLFINIAMIIVDKTRRFLTTAWNTEALEEDLRRVGMGETIDRLHKDIVFALGVSYQEGSNQNVHHG
jgi:hypothetical protein